MQEAREYAHTVVSVLGNGRRCKAYLPPAGSLTLLESHAWCSVSGALDQTWLQLKRTSPSKMPSPVVAQLGSTFHTWSLAIFSSCRRSETSFGRMAAGGQYLLGGYSCLQYAPPDKSCLLANTSSRASFISLSWMMRVSSVRASSMRSRSLESMTKMRPWVPARC
jgi:hypothetical protein